MPRLSAVGISGLQAGEDVKLDRLWEIGYASAAQIVYDWDARLGVYDWKPLEGEGDKESSRLCFAHATEDLDAMLFQSMLDIREHGLDRALEIAENVALCLMLREGPGVANPKWKH